MDSTHPLDLNNEDGVKAWIDAAADTHGGIDILYNNAGTTRFSPIADTSFPDWSFTIRNELDIVLLATKHAWPHLVARNGGCVLLVGSTAGLTGSLTNTRIAHTASKGAVVAMTRQLAAEGAAHGIRANCISPGMIRTPATEGDPLDDGHPCAPSPALSRSGASGHRKTSPALAGGLPDARPRLRSQCAAGWARSCGWRPVSACRAVAISHSATTPATSVASMASLASTNARMPATSITMPRAVARAM